MSHLRSTVLMPLLAALLLAGCAVGPDEGAEAPLEPVHVGPQALVRSVFDLLDHQPTLRPVRGHVDDRVSLSYRSGMDDIRHAALFADAEDGWVYVRRHGGGHWQDIGMSEQPRQAHMRLHLGNPALQGADELIFVHHHPARVALEQLIPLYRSMRATAGLDIDAFWDIVRRNHRHLFRVPPSLADFNTDALFRLKCERAGIGPVTSQVVTVLGTYTYRASPAVQALLIEDRPRAQRMYEDATSRNQTLGELLGKLRHAGFELSFEWIPGEYWPALKLWFERQLERADATGLRRQVIPVGRRHPHRPRRVLGGDGPRVGIGAPDERR